MKQECKETKFYPVKEKLNTSLLQNIRVDNIYSGAPGSDHVVPFVSILFPNILFYEKTIFYNLVKLNPSKQSIFYGSVILFFYFHLLPCAAIPNEWSFSTI